MTGNEQRNDRKQADKRQEMSKEMTENEQRNDRE
jgi:hypothetical protein